MPGEVMEEADEDTKRAAQKAAETQTPDVSRLLAVIMPFSWICFKT